MLERRAATWTNQAVLLTGTSSPKWLASFMCCAAVVGRLIALELSVVSQHDGDPKPIVPKDILTALRLNETMDLIVAPRLDVSRTWKADRVGPLLPIHILP
jgi:hypothetical protein